jgi:hypothetical protein
VLDRFVANLNSTLLVLERSIKMKIKTLLILVALLGIGFGYMGEDGQPGRVIARSATMPANPHIVYLSPADAVHGQLTIQTAQMRGMAMLAGWADVRKAAQNQPLDALLVERSKFAELSEDDRAWLRRQVEEGVVIAGIGIDIEAFSAALGLPTLRAPGEAPIPIGDDGYYLFQALLLGAPEDVQAMRDANWLERSILNDPIQLDTKNVLSVSVGGSRGKLATEQDTETFYTDLAGWIEGAYKSRAEFQQLSIENQ